MYSTYYENPFVNLQVVNRRVVVLGALGGQVIPLSYEDMTVIEVLALSGGLDNFSKANNIRLIRGDLDDPQVQVMDLSTIQGMREAQLLVQPNDIIYVEPIRRVVTESVRDVAPVVALLTSMITLLVLVISLNNGN